MCVLVTHIFYIQRSKFTSKAGEMSRVKHGSVVYILTSINVFAIM